MKVIFTPLMRILVPFIVVLLICNNVVTGQEDFVKSGREKKITLDIPKIQSTLSTAPLEDPLQKNQKSNTVITLPTPEGTTLEFNIKETHTLEKGMELAYPNLHTYSGTCVTNKNILLSMVSTANSIQCIVFSAEGNYSLIPSRESNGTYRCFYDKDIEDLVIGCGNQASALEEGNTALRSPNSCVRNGSDLVTIRTYKVAFASTSEFTRYIYAQSVGITTANFPTYKVPVAETSAAKTAVVSAFAALVNATNLIYKKELAIAFTLVNTPSIIFVDTNPSTTTIEGDPFYPYPNGASAAAAQTFFNNHTASIPFSNYDIGHVFHFNGLYSTSSFSGSGEASSSICSNSSKGKGWCQFGGIGSFPLSLHSSVFMHELGHQFGAMHTFNSANGNCTGSTSSSTSYEPGSGHSIMSYSNRCSPDNLGLGYSNFHANSLETINTTVEAATCGTSTLTSNHAPTANANPSAAAYVIPKSTCFVLTGAGNDEDNDALYYSWEQYDAGGTNSPPSPPSMGAGLATGPILRSFPPVTSPSRTFTGLVEGEYLPQVSRTLNFRLVVRDQKEAGGGIACDAVSVQVVDDVFKITSQNTATSWIAGTTASIQWNASGNNGSGANSPLLDFYFSADGGATYSPLLLATPNDGEQHITVPNTLTSTGLIKMQCSGENSIFFDLNDAYISIIGSCPTLASTISPTTSVSAEVGSAALNLPMSFQYPGISTKSFNIEATDQKMTLIGLNGTPAACTASGNTPYYEQFSFRASTTGTLSISISGGTLTNKVIHLYQGSFSSSSGCTNFLTSNATRPSGTGSYSLGNSISATLTAGNTYILVVSGFSTGQTGTVNVAFSSPVLDNNPPHLTYTYVSVDQSGIIRKIDTHADLRTFMAGTYAVYGISCLNSVDLSNYLGQSLTVLQSAINSNLLCATLSTNSLAVTVTANSVCPSLTLTSADQSICAGSTLGAFTVNTTQIGTNNIKWVRFSTAKNSNTMYSGGTLLGVATSVSGTSSYLPTPEQFPNNTANPITYYVYAIIDPLPANAACRPSVEIKVTVNPLPIVCSMTGGGTYCSGGTGIFIGLNGSSVGVSYQLQINNMNAGAAVNGTGSAFYFGLQTIPGTYSVVAKNISTGCTSKMNGTKTIATTTPLTAYSVTGGGSYCQGGTGVLMGLSGSTVGVSYQLKVGATNSGAAVNGTGSALNFGLKTAFGIYTVVATHNTTGCTATMTGSKTITNSAPSAFFVTGGGSYCAGSPGATVGLAGSTQGVRYQLKLGNENIGTPINGTGNALTFGLMTTAGTYKVVATHTTSGCSATMLGSRTVIINPLPTVFPVTGGGAQGSAIGLSGSSTGVFYRLINGNVNVGNAVYGTGNAISFGNQNAPGTYSVTAFNAATGCTISMSGNAIINGLSATPDREQETNIALGNIPNSMEVYQNRPNPFKDETVIGFLLSSNMEVHIAIYDRTGRIVFEQKGMYEKGENAIVLSASSLKTDNGMLFCKFTTAQQSKMIKILKIE